MKNDLSFEARAVSAMAGADFRFSHRLGQNFILDDGVMQEIASHTGAEDGDAVLEIGPGAGTLTRALAARGANVLAVEVDETLKPVLEGLFAEEPRVRFRFADIMKCDIAALREELLPLSASGRIRMAANLPYYITTDVLTAFASAPAEFDSLTVMVQREAAERITAVRGSKQYCHLACLLNWRYDIRAVMELPRSLFTPQPHVDSTLLTFTPRADAMEHVSDRAMLLAVMKAAFLQRRKTMANNLCAAFSLSRENALVVLTEAGLSATVRGEALEIETLKALANVLLAKQREQ